MKGVYRVPEDGEISELENNLVEEGIFVLMNVDTALCLSRDNIHIERPCNVMNDYQRWEIDQHGRLEASGNPYSCITAFANALDFKFVMTCYPCNLGQTAHRKCSPSADLRNPMIVKNELLSQGGLSQRIESLKLIAVPMSETHSLLYYTTGQCLTESGSPTSGVCTPECFKGIATEDMCDNPLGIGRVLCSFEDRGTLVSLMGDNSLLERGTSTKIGVKGETSGATALLVSGLGKHSHTVGPSLKLF